MLVFDIGSNATKASLVLEKHIVRDWRISTKIGKDVLPDGSLSDDAIARQCSAIAQILDEARTIARDQLCPVHALGTQALRKAPNAQKLVDIIAVKYAFQLEIISGIREAELEKIAVWHSKAREMHEGSRILMIDSGGSSTEYNLLDSDGSTIQQASYPFGQHAMLDAIAAKRDMPFVQMMHDLKDLCRLNAPKILIAAGSSMTSYARYALKLDAFDAERVESKQIPHDAEIPSDDSAALIGKCLASAFESALHLPIFVTTRGIRHGWIALNEGCSMAPEDE